MGGFRGRPVGRCVAVATGLGALGLCAIGLAAPSYADTTVTVQGTRFPDPASANLSFVGCDDLYQRGAEDLVPTVGTGPGVPVAGTRSLGWDLAGGNAVGALFAVGSMLSTTTAGMSVNAEGRATGVAYAGYQEPADAGTSLLWLGRTELVTPGGAWQTIDVASRPYTWAKYDMTTHQLVADGPGVPTTVAGFAAAHGGDGPGVFTIGFGCDGTPFSMDRLQVGAPGAVTTYDLEGLQTAVTIAREPAGSGDQVTITGRLRTLTGDPVPHATMVLERRTPDSSQWKQVQVADVEDGQVKATVDRGEKAFYRWRFVERPLAEGSTSMALLVDALSPLPTQPPAPTGSPSPSGPTPPSPAPTTPGQPSGPGSSAPPTGGPDTPSQSPSESGPESGPPSTTPSSLSPDASSPAVPPTLTPTDRADESASPQGSDSHGTP